MNLIKGIIIAIHAVFAGVWASAIVAGWSTVPAIFHVACACLAAQSIGMIVAIARGKADDELERISKQL